MQFVGKVFNTVSEFYKDINPSTLSGAIDIVVVEDESGNLSCSPFHVRFGKLHLFRPQEKVVEIKVNGKVIDIPMKVGEAGETFFVLESKGSVPAELVTSPIPNMNNAEDLEIEELDLSKLRKTRPSESKLEDQRQLVTDSSAENHSQSVSIQSEENQLFENQSNNQSKNNQSKNNQDESEVRDQLVESFRQDANLILEDLKKQIESEESNHSKFEIVVDETKNTESHSDISVKKVSESHSDIHVRKEKTSLTDFVLRDKSAGYPQSDTELEYSKHLAMAEGPMSDTEMEYADVKGQDNWKWDWGSLPSKDTNEWDLAKVASVSSEASAGSVNVESAAVLTPETSFKKPTENKQKTTEIYKLISSLNQSNQWATEKLSQFCKMLNHESSVEISLCGNIQVSHLNEANAKFNENKVDSAMFLANCKILENPNLVVRFGEMADFMFTSKFILPVLSYQMIYKKEVKLEDLKKFWQEFAKGSEQKGVSLWNWWSRNPKEENLETTVVSASSNSTLSSSPSKNIEVPTAHLVKSNSDAEISQTIRSETPRKSKSRPVYVKTLRLNSTQLKSLNLNYGSNQITFSVSAKYQGTTTCTARIFLWKYNTKIVVSDIDGTITKSDALGHLFTMVGKDWTHSGVASLYTSIVKNGFQILYLTSRAIGQANFTREYLKGVEQGQHQLPEGPVIMSPDRLLTAFRREVIIGRPEEFKIACLRDISKLFGNRNPFYAGFGNRITDGLSYRSVGIPSSKIFTVNSQGELKLELLSFYKSSYGKLNDLVDQIFPPDFCTIEESFNDFSYWREPMMAIPKLPVAEVDKSQDDLLYVTEGLLSEGEEDEAYPYV